MYFLIDTETTGLTKKTTDFLAQPGIVQLGIVILDEKYREIDAYSSYVNPEMGTWEEGAIRTHGITKEKVADAPTFFEVFDKLAAMATRGKFWCGYNTTFDKDVVYYQLQRYGFERNFPWPRYELDVMKVATDHFGEQGKKGTRNLKQTDVYERLFKRPLADAHDALADIRACAEILRELRRE